MDFDTILKGAVAVCFVLGAADDALGGRFGLAQEYKNGIMACGRLLLCMAGFMVLAPVIARGLGPVTAPFFRAIGADPSLLAGLLLANDSGGMSLAIELADDPLAGQFNGMIVGATMGTAVMFNINLSLNGADSKERPSIIYGLLAGMITLPLGCAVGGACMGMPTGMLLGNVFPIAVLSGILLVLLLRLKEKIVPAFVALGKLIVVISSLGLAVGAVQLLTGFELFPGADTLENVFPVVGNIAMFLGGILPLLAILRRVFARALRAGAGALHTNEIGVAGLVMALANGLPVFAMLHDMDDRGRMLNVAFLTSASCLLGDHMAYASQVAPQLCVPMMAGKAVGGITALVAALLLAPRLLKKQSLTATQE